jgi:hypothetical protein
MAMRDSFENEFFHFKIRTGFYSNKSVYKIGIGAIKYVLLVAKLDIGKGIFSSFADIIKLAINGQFKMQ